MKYSEIYQRSRDIDWFFRAGDRCIHVASNGGLLPAFVNNVINLRQKQAEVAVLDYLINDNEVLVNDDYVNSRIDNSFQRDIDSIVRRDNYLRSFISMAKKGFYSYDRVTETDFDYVLICCPIRQVEVNVEMMEPGEEIVFDNEKRYFRVESKSSSKCLN